MSPFIAWALVCFVVAVVLFLLEVAVTGVVLLFIESQTLGLIGMLICLVAIPFMLAFAIRVWPSTPIARMLTLGNPEVSFGDSPDDQAALESDTHHDAAVAMGAQGQALSDLRPVGLCRFGDTRIDCLAADGVIDSGDTVEVVSADGMQIKVRRVRPR